MRQNFTNWFAISAAELQNNSKPNITGSISTPNTHITKQHFAALGKQFPKDIRIEQIFWDPVDKEGSGVELLIVVEYQWRPVRPHDTPPQETSSERLFGVLCVLAVLELYEPTALHVAGLKGTEKEGSGNLAKWRQHVLREMFMKYK